MDTLDGIDGTGSQNQAALLRPAAGSSRQQLASRIDEAMRDAQNFRGIEVVMLSGEVDLEVADKLLGFCGACPRSAPTALRIAHTDLSSGGDCEQVLFERLAEHVIREADKAREIKNKSDSGKEKEFSMAASKRRAAEAGIVAATERLAQIDKDLVDLNRRKTETPWYALFTSLGAKNRNTVGCLDLSNCCLHATGLVMLTQVLLELEQRADGRPVTDLTLDGNDVGDLGMSAICNYMRITNHCRVLRLRNVGLTERGISQVLSGLVSNKSLALLDLRSNGLASVEVSKAALSGVQRFNKAVEVLLE